MFSVNPCKHNKWRLLCASFSFFLENFVWNEIFFFNFKHKCGYICYHFENYLVICCLYQQNLSEVKNFAHFSLIYCFHCFLHNRKSIASIKSKAKKSFDVTIFTTFDHLLSCGVSLKYVAYHLPDGSTPYNSSPQAPCSLILPYILSMAARKWVLSN